MTTANEMQLRDREIYPTEAILSSVLGDSFSAYSDLLSLLKANNLNPEWRYYNDGKAWLCKVQKAMRTIVWISVWEGFAKATIYISQKHLPVISGLGIQPQYLQAILDSKPIGKLQPCMFEIRTSHVLDDFEKIMQFKIVNK